LPRCIFQNQDPGAILQVKCDISDPHLGGRQTVILSFGRGSLVYKPRNGLNERAWFSLLDLINREGFEPRFRTLCVVPRDRYCWVEFVRAKPCKSKAEARNYYRRAGGLLCLTYFTGAIDCHCENLIASGDQPVLIDAETLLHREPEFFSHRGPALLLRSGLLPAPQSNCEGDYLVSALGKGIPGPHVPTLRGRALVTRAYVADMDRGFRDMWNLIGEPQAQTRAAFCKRIRQMRRLEWRRVCYPTSKYIEIRDASVEPAALQSGIARWRTIGMKAYRKNGPKAILKEEIRALMRLDIPYFTERSPMNSVRPSSSPLPEMLDWLRSTLASH